MVRSDTSLRFLLFAAASTASAASTTSAASAATRATADDRMTIANMTCAYFTQPLNHFVPRGKSPSYQQRYCYYSGFAPAPLLAPSSASCSHASRAGECARNGNDDGNDHGNDYGNGEDDAAADATPILFYTGNESPLEQYINHTGLMWELAPELGAHVVFAEHRYEGHSLPPANLTTDCMSYASTTQALADFATLIQYINPGGKAPLVAFGGSYGGMLSAWFRMKYPHLVAGAIAASAPIGAFPQQAYDKIDSSAQIIAAAMELDYPSVKSSSPTPPTSSISSASSSSLPSQPSQQSQPSQPSRSTRRSSSQDNHCSTNLMAAWPLIHYLIDTGHGTFLQLMFSLCEPLKDADDLLEWAQALWFDLAEGEFPYPSSYIPFALLHKKVELPAWPIQTACWNISQLHADWGVHIEGDVSSVNYTITYAESGLTLHVDWDRVAAVQAIKSDAHMGNADGGSATDSSDASKATIKRTERVLHDARNTPPIEDNDEIIGLLTSVRDAVSIWYNITKDLPCYDVSEPAPNRKKRMPTRSTARSTARMVTSSLSSSSSAAAADTEAASASQETTREGNLKRRVPPLQADPASVCQSQIHTTGSWEPVCCNDDLNLIITVARGLGKDFFWPPSHPRGTKVYADIVKNVPPSVCPDPDGVFGYSTQPLDLWSEWLDAYYGSGHMQGHSNIVFSNGMLDPWSAGGIYAMDPTPRGTRPAVSPKAGGGMVQNVTDDGSIIALLIELGGHHTDLMYSDQRDPECVSQARSIEHDRIVTWINQWRDGGQRS